MQCCTVHISLISLILAVQDTVAATCFSEVLNTPVGVGMVDGVPGC
jgi:hypothetical protein